MEEETFNWNVQSRQALSILRWKERHFPQQDSLCTDVEMGKGSEQTRISLCPEHTNYPAATVFENLLSLGAEGDA